MKQSTLIQEIERYLKDQLAFAENLQKLDEEQLHRKPADGGWNILQCIEHLNRYGDFYLDEISQKIQKAQPYPADKEFKSGFFGRFFTSMMLPKKGMIKMKTFADKNPDAAAVDQSVLDKFIRQLKQWQKLLEDCRSVDLNKNNCRLTLPFLNMNMGSTLRFVIYHNERHVVQAKRLL